MKNTTKNDLIINAGRIIDFEEEELIKELASDYIRNIFNLISLLKYKTVVFDFDRTLTKFQYDEHRILPCDESDLYEYSKTHNIYENAKMIKTMQYVMSQLEENDLYIVTNSVETIKDKKDALIDATCKYIPKEHVIFQTAKTQRLACGIKAVLILADEI